MVKNVFLYKLFVFESSTYGRASVTNSTLLSFSIFAVSNVFSSMFSSVVAATAATSPLAAFWSWCSQALFSLPHPLLSCGTLKGGKKCNFSQKILIFQAKKMHFINVFLSNFVETWCNCSTHEYYNLTKFQQNWIKQKKSFYLCTACLLLLLARGMATAAILRPFMTI